VRDFELERKIGLLRVVIRAMAVMNGAGAIAALLEPANDVRVTVPFYLVILAVIYALHRAVRPSTVTFGAWAVSLFLWCLVAFVTLFFGGLQGQTASVFCGCAVLLSALTDGRYGFAMALGSSLWSGGVAFLEARHSLPHQIGPGYTPLNAWQTMSITSALVTVIMWNSQKSMQVMHAQTVKAASERDEALQRSIESQKMELVGKLASGVAHDFNNLLTVISGASEALRDTATTPHGRTLLIDEIDDASARAGLLIRQLLAAGRARTPQVTTLDLAEQVTLFGRLVPRLVGGAITVELDTAPGALIEGSKLAVEQILLNLVVNAREAMPAGGHLTVRVHASDGQVLLTVKDTGEGIPLAIREKIFSPFFTTKPGGTGLGLATVHDCVTQLGGRVEVTCPAAGGTEFVVSLPMATREKSDAPASSDGRGKVLLVVDDDAPVLASLARQPRRADYEVLTATDGASALAILEKRPDVSCVVSDVNMPGMDGRELARTIAGRTPSLPVLLVSGGQRVEAEGERRAFLAKPVTGEALLVAVSELLYGGRTPSS
jgi:signal transduction histidine kinase